MSRWGEIRELTRVRVLLFLREPEGLFWVFGFPIIMSVVLGFAFSTSAIEPSRIGILPGDDPHGIAAAIEDDDSIRLFRVAEAEEGRRSLRKGALDVLVAPGATPEIRYDPARPEAIMAKLRLDRRLATEPAARVGMREVTEAEVGSRYIDFLFPGLLGINIMGTGVWITGFAIADLRQKKLLKRLLVTPMRRSSFLFSFLISRLVFLVFEVGALLFFALVVLGVPFAGDVASFAVFTLLSAVVFGGLGLLLASRAKTIEAVSGLMNLAIMPMWLCSGVFFSYERFPELLHPVIRLLPLTAVNDGLRTIMLDGGSLAAVLPQVAVLTVWSVTCFGIALKFFRWR